jgi:SAM-dependent methyltransferase
MTDYDRLYAQHASYFGSEPSPMLVEHAGLIPTGSRVLDIGIGQGRHALHLARHGYEVTGIDPSRAALDAVRERAVAEGLSLELVPCSFEDYEPGPEPFAAILIFGLLQTLTRTQGASLLHRLRAWTRRGSLVYLTAWHVDDPAYAEISATWRQIGLHSYCNQEDQVRTFLARGEILDLMIGWWQVHHWEGLGPEHRHGDGPPERHGVVELVAARLR